MKKLVIPVIIVILDQFVKFLIKDVFEFNYVQNTGGAFGIGENSTILVTVLSILLIAVILRVLLNKKLELPSSIYYGLLLILSGGTGNLIDRILRGYVIDYIDITKLIDYPVFNLADICIVAGVILVMITILITTVKKQENSVK